ncbi:uncharacterized protein K460DRAFT_351915 [Cucurbitaria berberidis CBS 394.84]|uniref:BHLH domain-containing protein n=1 Tax=Cucurbitaria berberidis CBS 394.84 TaxID=1168544 RepID=A0A9P4LEL4_9PLEO|nr:uncharacterized protein K460DRAFT_351915 [Cucurbitaria berberidis CBS 394.84]KAF1852068.1 hypothetical protein K460DRAFT_351915 [Cucurbitaria berberidis CBS 394.84]
MHLLNTSTLRLEDFVIATPDICHSIARVGDDEVTFNEINLPNGKGMGRRNRRFGASRLGGRGRNRRHVNMGTCPGPCHGARNTSNDDSSPTVSPTITPEDTWTTPDGDANADADATAYRHRYPPSPEQSLHLQQPLTAIRTTSRPSAPAPPHAAKVETLSLQPFAGLAGATATRPAMDDKDPPPFGYTFSDFFEGAPSTLDSTGQSLLTDMENQSLADFFSSTDPFHLADPQPFASATDTKDIAHDYNHWESFIAPATVHGVTTTIPDYAHLHYGYQSDQSFAQPSLPTHDDLQAASTLFNNSQPSYSNGRSLSFNALPPSNRTATTTTNGASDSSKPPVPMVVTSHGLINEQLAALIPNHSEEGTLDAQLAAEWAASNAQQQHEAEFGPLLHKPSLKRSYTFGTDNSFNSPSGYSAPSGQESEEQITRRLIRGVMHTQPIPQVMTRVERPATSPTGHGHLSSVLADNQSDDEQSEEPSSEEEEGDRPVKKRRRSKFPVGKESPRKTARNGKNPKASPADESSKKKRSSAAAAKLQRENLTEAQKRSNHILSEQKRRNLIKRGFEDLHDLVPEIRNGGLSKSSVLTEAANFLEKLIQDNNSFWSLASNAPVTASG